VNFFFIPTSLPNARFYKNIASGMGQDSGFKSLQYRVNLYPRSAEARVDFGDAYRRNGQAAEARERYNQVLALVPGHVAAALKLAELDKK
jgi:tetratricopeptide (TPR) repeat protein